MQAYVAGFMFGPANRVPLVRKLKPEWQNGLLNGIGGKIEAGETPLAAMRREWREETGNDHADWYHFVSIRGENSLVHFFRTFVDNLPGILAYNDVGEQNVIVSPAMLSPVSPVVPNLHWLIPLALDKTGFDVVMPNSTELYGAIPNVKRVGLPPMQEQPVRR
jgi:8-oxo-dGTP diphosphatase